MKDTIEENITREIFDKTLYSFIENGSVKCSLISNGICLSLRKHNDFVFKSCLKEQINLLEKGEILKTDLETADVLNTFCGNIVKDLETNLYPNFEQLKLLNK